MNITTAEIRKAVKDSIGHLGLQVYYAEDLPSGEITQERAVIVTSSDSFGNIWSTCLVTLSVCVPDLAPRVANLSRLNKLERIIQATFHDGYVGSKGDDDYCISLDKIGIEYDTQFKCHFVNAKLVFKTLNVKN